jgi:hypothetical protein
LAIPWIALLLWFVRVLAMARARSRWRAVAPIALRIVASFLSRIAPRLCRVFG